MGIGALAKRAGAKIDTVRYWKRSCLLEPRGRLTSPGSSSRPCASSVERRRSDSNLSEVRDPLALSAAGVLFPRFGLLLSPIVVAAAMGLCSVFVSGNALRLRFVRV
jgi:hypothetical protein